MAAAVSNGIIIMLAMLMARKSLVSINNALNNSITLALAYWKAQKLGENRSIAKWHIDTSAKIWRIEVGVAAWHIKKHRNIALQKTPAKAEKLWRRRQPAANELKAYHGGEGGEGMTAAAASVAAQRRSHLARTA